MILEVIYEPTFMECSHGFRPKKSCHTALKYVEQRFNGVKRIVEGDIKGVYDNVNHKILIGILEERIQDEKFINLIRKALTAGYLESGAGLIKSFIGTPQGSLVSPILANIYLDKLDIFVNQLKKKYENSNKEKPWKGVGKYTNEYNNLRNKIRQISGMIKNLPENEEERKGKTKELLKLKVELRKTRLKEPTSVPIKIQYVRYADDWIVGVNGPVYIAQKIKTEIGDFLSKTLGLKLSDEKTKITYVRLNFVLFLGYNIKIDTSRKVSKYRTNNDNLVVRRTTGHIIKFYLPIERYLSRLILKGFCDKEGRARSMPQWIGLEAHRIVMLYNYVLNGTFFYYSHIQNTDDLRRIQFILQMSCAKTLAHKYKCSTSKIFRKHGDKLKVPKSQNSKSDTKKEQYAELHIRDRIIRNGAWKISVEPFDPYKVQTNLRSRSKLDAHCAICLSKENVEMHHIKHVRKAQTAKGFNKLLSIIKRKQLPTCRDCHKKLHSGLYDGLNLIDLADQGLAKL